MCPVVVLCRAPSHLGSQSAQRLIVNTWYRRPSRWAESQGREALRPGLWLARAAARQAERWLEQWTSLGLVDSAAQGQALLELRARYRYATPQMLILLHRGPAAGA